MPGTLLNCYPSNLFTSHNNTLKGNNHIGTTVTLFDRNLKHTVINEPAQGSVSK